MLFVGTIVNGTVIFDVPPGLLDGTRVYVVVKLETKPASNLGAMLLRHAGKATGLPEDAAAQHDHSLDDPFCPKMLVR